MKTGKELILDLPNGVRRNFILALAKHSGYEKATKFLNSEWSSLEMVISGAFVWSDSEKGRHYWNKIYNGIQS